MFPVGPSLSRIDRKSGRLDHSGVYTCGPARKIYRGMTPRHPLAWAAVTDADPTPARLLDAALAADGARPLLTSYDDASGERTELSVATFANWVAKTANLLQDELGTEPGSTVAVLLPLHWQAAVWVHAAWAAGHVVDLDGEAPAEVAVVEHTRAGLGTAAGDVVSLGLGPMGLPRPGSTPAYPGALDYDRAVHGHGDRFTPVRAHGPADLALRAGGRSVTAGALGRAALASPPLPGGGRLLVTDPLRTVEDVLAALLVPAATGAATVLCRHLDPARLPDRIVQENVVATLGAEAGQAGALPRYRPVSPP